MDEPDPQTRDLRAALRPQQAQAPKDRRNVPPLVWLVIALLIVVAAIAYLSLRKTPMGPIETTPASSSAATSSSS